MYFQFFKLDNNFHAFMKVGTLLTELFTDDDGNVNFYILCWESFPRIKYAFKADAARKIFQREMKGERKREHRARKDV